MKDQIQQVRDKTKKQMDDNIIFIGQKPLLNYVTAIVMQMTTKSKSETKIVARGKFINKAVDAVEVARARFLKGDNEIVVKDIKIGSEQFTKKDEVSNEERTFNVSTIEIPISKV